jgi:hypothetical protein
MKKRTMLFLVATHCAIGAFGFGIGIYMLPILTAPDAPTDSQVSEITAQASYTTQFRRDLRDSDMLHWGEGTVSVSTRHISFMGKLAPGPDYKLYLSPEFVETEDDFNRLKASMQRVGDVKTFDNFIVEMPPGIDPAKFTSVIIWCEAFSQFITAGKYRNK